MKSQIFMEHISNKSNTIKRNIDNLQTSNYKDYYHDQVRLRNERLMQH